RFLGLCALQRPVHRCPPNLERLGNLSGPHALRPHYAHLRYVNRGRPALVDAFRLGLGDTLKLTFATEVRLELGEHAEHVEEAFTGRGACIDRLFSCLERCATRLHRAHDVLQVADATSKAIDAGDHQHVTLAEEVEDG